MAAAPHWSPDGSKIAFVSKGAVHVIGVDGRGKRRLTRGPIEDEDPAWSPDGRKIAFASGRFPSCDVSVVNADGSGRRRLTRSGACAHFAAWSPDGKRIAFTNERADYDAQIFVMNADGSGERRLTKGPRFGASDYAPMWRPSGKR